MEYILSYVKDIISVNDYNMLENTDPTILYDCSVNTKSSYCTFLMKLVILSNKYDLVDIIEDYSRSNIEDINKINDKGWTALNIASRNNNTRVARILLRYADNYDLINMLNYDDYNMIISTDTTIEYMCTPYIKASCFTKLMKYIILVKKYPEIKGYITSYIKLNPTEVNKINSSGWNALHLILYHDKNNIEIIKMLINGITIFAVCNNNTILNILLSQPINNNTLAIIDMLASYDIKSLVNNDPIYQAIFSYSSNEYKLKVVKMLLDIGFITKIEDIVNRCYEEGIELVDYYNIIQLLINNGLSIEKVNMLDKDKICLGMQYQDTIAHNEKAPTCVICLEHMAILLAQPCNHLILCSKCYQQSRTKECYICRKPITTICRVYFNN